MDAKIIVRDNKYVVREGSKIDPNYYSNIPTIKSKRKEFESYIDETGDTIVKDIEFDSPSMAACFVRGGASNGKYYWRTEDDRPLNDFIEYL